MSVDVGLITSQIDTAPKRGKWPDAQQLRLITSQIDTAPKRRKWGHPNITV